jgi:hypothetical protein
VESFRALDRVSQRLGFLGRDASYATRVPWWPLVAVLGLYSSGKSTFVNHYLEYELQTTGNQAVDDRFTVICFSGEDAVRVLPGLAVDADPRLPFYQMSDALDQVADGEGQRVDAYLQLKTCPSEKLRGKIFIDSPGFDADAQRTATLRITNHIIDLSDLVLVFFDARHPEVGSMHDTLEHLVRGTIHRPDSSKFLYILNQMDTAAGEDNPEHVFAAWQRALAQHGLTAGHYYSIYDPKRAVPIEDPSLRARFEGKRDADLAEIYHRIEQVGVERAYRIVGMIHQTGRTLEQEVVPRILQFMGEWRRRVLWADAVIFGTLLVVFGAVTVWGGYWQDSSLHLPLLGEVTGNTGKQIGLYVLGLVIAGLIHLRVRARAATRVSRRLLEGVESRDLQVNYARAFRRNSRWWRSVFARSPAGWGKRARSFIAKVLEDADRYVQRLNDLYTDPSGAEVQTPQEVAEPETSERAVVGFDGLPGLGSGGRTVPGND